MEFYIGYLGGHILVCLLQSQGHSDSPARTDRYSDRNQDAYRHENAHQHGNGNLKPDYYLHFYGHLSARNLYPYTCFHLHAHQYGQLHAYRHGHPHAAWGPGLVASPLPDFFITETARSAS